MKRPGKNGHRSANVPDGLSAVVFPGPEGWELWTGPGPQAVCVGTADEPRKLRPPPGSTVGISSRCFLSMPLWVPVIGESAGREQTQIRLEMKGLLGTNPEDAVWASELIRSEPSPAGPEGEPARRQLESTAVLASPFPEDLLLEEAGRYEPAGRLMDAPPGGTAGGVLRRELGRWVADFYVGGKWLHTQPLLAGGLGTAAAMELRTTVAQLQAEGLLSELEGWFLRDAEPAPEEFARVLETPLRRMDRPAPVQLPGGWNLPPPAWTERRAQRTMRHRRKRQIRLALIGYLAGLFLLLGWLGAPLIQLRLARAELARIAEEAGRIRQTALVWQEAGACVDLRRNALELLWQVSRPLIEGQLPKIEGVNLTLFDIDGQRLLIQGEGNDLEVVEKYFNWLKAEPALAFFRWKNSQPRLLPNGFAQFQAEGLLPGAAPAEGEGGDGANTDTP